MLDGNEFIGCVFTNVELIYRGGSIPVLDSNTISGCLWRFEDGALRTVDFLRALNRGGMDPVVDEIIQSIKGAFPPPTAGGIH